MDVPKNKLWNECQMSEKHSCVFTLSENLWKQHRDNLERTRTTPPCHRDNLILALTHQAADVAKNALADITGEMSVVRDTVVFEMSENDSHVDMLHREMKLLEPIFGKIDYTIEVDANNHASLNVGTGVLMQILQLAALTPDLASATMSLMKTGQQMTKQVEFVLESTEMQCQVLAEDHDFMDNLDEGEALPRSKSVASQLDEQEIGNPGLYCYSTATELINTKNVEMVTLAVQSLSEIFTHLNNSTREAWPILQEVCDALRKNRLKILDERQKAKEAEELAARRRNTFTIIK